MSTGLNCEYIEVELGKWYYILEHGDAPKCAFDWRDHADAVGPFSSFETAYEHLHQHNANPGGYCRRNYTEDMKLSNSVKRLIEEAQAPVSAWRSFRNWY